MEALAKGSRSNEEKWDCQSAPRSSRMSCYRQKLENATLGECTQRKLTSIWWFGM